ncbi:MULTISPECIES: alanine racemase [unclassified Enterococcus]|uniref:alanine racemase n=1 Tax=unclassified Enterococcus TaxID=2608891 RepID=UPI001554AA2D|nr:MULTISPECIES: alanine racemase [unclassified Enterococcus]MBS7577256.1 alanine racemase [Enterococcus sp. MMGLQ5-2]MBS7584651.1 alanine racemase [Enterococcus sp. MMGLQ5-1]NPD12506.1 alanine racemase [Enterococcus sp. MMGLQ5-1]NPD37090.1 alanine racemase [Enterococcus sp. MMGLQ5-2]
MINSKHRPTVALIDLDAICWNIKQEQRHSNNSEIFAVVKANGYGHGAVEVAKAALSSGVSGLCVSNLDEALDLRKNGISSPILVLSEIPVAYIDLAIANQITLTVASLYFLEALAFNADLAKLKIHLKLDTGMGRIGLRNVEEVKAAERLINRLNLQLEGVFTHFATADEATTDYFNRQVQRFKKLKSALAVIPKYVHVSNTATAFWHQQCDGNLIRYGIGMYGLNPSGKTLDLPFELKPALALISQLSYVKQVKKDEFISYGATYETKTNEWIGTVPIGYADGWLRRLQGFKVLVEGEYCEIVGRICMDQLMLRLPRSFSIGTKVTLIGKDRDEEVSATSVAEFSQTINYEITCGLSDRIPRIFQIKD